MEWQSKEGLFELGKKAEAERIVHLTSILTELPQNMKWKLKKITPQRKLRQCKQPDWWCYAR